MAESKISDLCKCVRVRVCLKVLQQGSIFVVLVKLAKSLKRKRETWCIDDSRFPFSPFASLSQYSSTVSNDSVPNL